MKAARDDRTVTLTMTRREAADLENELLWSSKDDDEQSRRLYEVLAELSEGDPS